MILIKFCTQGGSYMDNLGIMLDDTVRDVLLHANELSQRSGAQSITDVIAFVQLAKEEKTCFHSFLVSHSVTKEKIENESRKIISKYWERAIIEDEIGIETTIFNSTGKNVSIKISQSLLNAIFIANGIAHDLYLFDQVNDNFLLAAFTETMPDIYEEFIENCLENKKSNKSIGAKKEMEKKNFYLPYDLASFLTVMNDKYISYEKCPILGRDTETNQLVKILSKATKRNAILVGYPGVGKTAIIEKFVYSIVKGTCPEKFKDSVVLSLDVTSIIAGTQYRGQAEERFQDLIDFLENYPKCILFIDEIHTVLGAGACKDGELDLANALKPILARGDTQVIGATTFDEYEKYFSRDGALQRRFEKIVVEEPKSTELYNMIKNQIARLENYHQTTISRKLVNDAILLAGCFNNYIRNPDRTLDLLDRSMASAELKGRHFVKRNDILENFDIKRKQFEKMSKEEKTATAYHEAGHFIVNKFSKQLSNTVTLAVSIMPAEEYLGVNVCEPNDETVFTNKDYFIQLIARYLGGRIAEKMYTKQLSAGASSDLEKATQIAEKMVLRYGLAEDLSTNRSYSSNIKNDLYTDDLLEIINKEIDKILDEAEEYAVEILQDNKDSLEMLVSGLLEKGILSKVDLDAMFCKTKIIK